MVRLAILGDSIAYGTGAGHPDDALGPRLVAYLAVADLEARATVVAVPGARSSDLGAQVDRCAHPRPDVAVVVIGANDLTRLIPPEQAAADLRAAVRRLRAMGTDVVLAPAPDLSAVPHVPVAARALVRTVSLQLRRAQMRVTLDEGGWVADAEGLTTAAFATDRTLFSADRFHPSSAGYAVISAALAPVVRAVAQARVARRSD